jgi:hypothetical protein
VRKWISDELEATMSFPGIDSKDKKEAKKEDFKLAKVIRVINSKFFNSYFLYFFAFLNIGLYIYFF